jgi:hypothetical protein
MVMVYTRSKGLWAQVPDTVYTHLHEAPRS